MNHFKDNTTFVKEGISLWQFSSTSMCWKTSMHHQTVCFTWGILNKQTAYNVTAHRDLTWFQSNCFQYLGALNQTAQSKEQLLLVSMWKSLLGESIIILSCLYSGALVSAGELVGATRMQIFNNNRHQIHPSLMKIWGLEESVFTSSDNIKLGCWYWTTLLQNLDTCNMLFKPTDVSTQGTLASHTWGCWVTYKS